MKSQRSLVGFAVCAALAAAGCASGGRPGPVGPGTRVAGGGGGSSTAMAAAEKDLGTRPSASPAAEGGGGGGAPAARSAPPSAAPRDAGSGGLWSSYDRWMQRMGNRLSESSFLGMRIHPHLSEEVDFTDNAFYQDDHEKVVVNTDADNDGIQAVPNLGKPRARVAEIVNNASAGIDFDMPLNVALVPVVGGGQESVKVLGTNATAVNYLREDDSPDALNYQVSLDLPALVNQLLSRLKEFDASRNAFYVRVEGDYSKVTDPLDVAQYAVFSAPATFRNQGSRNTFTRREWFAKGTLGWRGPILDAKISYEHYNLFLYDDSLKPANHDEDTLYAEVGWRKRGSEHRWYGFYELKDYDFDSRGDPLTDPDATSALRDFARQRTGAGWEGPFLSKKVQGNIELYYLSTEIFDKGPLSVQPIDFDPATGVAFTNGAGNFIRERLNQRATVGGSTTMTYRPFVTKATQVQGKYSRDVGWSVVGQDKIVDSGSLTLSHPVSDKWTAEVSTNVSMENVQHREKRLYTEVGLGGRYRLAAYTDVFLRYTWRHMRSRREPAAQFADSANEPYIVRANGDFTANIVSLGVSIKF